MDHLNEIKALGERVVEAYTLANFEPFFELSADLNCVASKSGYFIRLNAAWEQVLGWSKEELLSRPWLDFVHPDDKKRTLQAAKTMEKDKVFGFKNRYRCKNGEYKELVWRTLKWNDSGFTFCIAKPV